MAGGLVQWAVSSESLPSGLCPESLKSVCRAGGQDGCLGLLAICALPALGLSLGLNVAQGLLVSTWLGFPC